MNFDSKIASGMLEEARALLDISLASPSERPYLVILGGQPGSGKSHAIEKIEERFSDNIISFNGDDYKLYYPNYQQILAVDPIQTSQRVQPYSNHVVNELKKEYSDKKYNMIIEGTMRTTEVPLSTVNEFKNKGYQVEAYVIAANYYASRTGCLYRMEMDISEYGHGRAVSVEAHDAAYRNILNTLANLNMSGKLDDITILTRDGQFLGSIKNGDEIVYIYEEHRNKLSIKEYNQINKNLNEVINKMNLRNASQEAISQVSDLQGQLKLNYENYQETNYDLTLPIQKEDSLGAKIVFTVQ